MRGRPRAETALDTATSVAGAVAASGVGIIVAAVIFAITAAVQEGLSVFTVAALPGQLAEDVVGAPTATYDLGSMLSNGSQAQGLYSLFVGSTEPDPTFTTCNNNPGGIVREPEYGPGGEAPCLDPTPVPTPASYDPQWVVTSEGSTTSTTQPTITSTDSATQLTFTTYLAGNWFVSTATIGGFAATVQSLRLQYTDWNGNEDTAWAFDTANPPSSWWSTIPTSAAASTSAPARPAEPARSPRTSIYLETRELLQRWPRRPRARRLTCI